MEELGFDESLAFFAAMIASITKFFIYPVVRIRKRVVTGFDPYLLEPKGPFFVHPDLHSSLALLVVVAISAAYSVTTSTPLFPVLSAAAAGFAAARTAHEGIGVIKK
jgi:hypothetical protein